MRGEFPPLVFIPGLVCDQEVFRGQVQALSPFADWTVAEHGALASLPAMAEAILRTAPQRFAVVGHSMGGRVALEVFRAAPERIAGMALLDTGYQPRPTGEAGDREAADRYRLLELARRSGMRAMGAEWVRGMVHPDRLADTTLIEAVLAMIGRKTPAVFEAQIRALLDRPDAGPLLATIRCPVAVICGRDDSWSPLARHEQMAGMIPDSVLEVIECSGHMSTMERPLDVLTALQRWLFLTTRRPDKPLS